MEVDGSDASADQHGDVDHDIVDSYEETHHAFWRPPPVWPPAGPQFFPLRCCRILRRLDAHDNAA